MKLIKPSFEIIEQAPSIEGAWAMAAKAARICYLSEKTNPDETEEEFCKRILLRNKNLNACHLTPLEHGTVHLKLTNKVPWFYNTNPYSSINVEKPDPDYNCYITTNLRVLLESDRMDDLQFWCDKEALCPKRVTVKFICDRATALEFIRHRKMSINQESQRYCNYSKEKFGQEITFVEPCWEVSDLARYDFLEGLQRSENAYFHLLADGWKPEQARTILPNATKTTLLMTGFVSDWQHFFDLRADGISGKPHPSASELSIPLKQEFIKRGLL